MATKDYSSKQEKMIADYLGWECVVASGARDCHPGDIITDNWLGECKTHVTTGNRIKFMFRDWDKIIEEATSKFKFPVLFADDGSQKEQNTWCMLDSKTAPIENIPVNTRVVAKKSLFLSTDLMTACDNCSQKMLRFDFNGRYVLVMRLSTFKEYC